MNVRPALLALAFIAAAVAPAVAQQFAVTDEVAVTDPRPAVTRGDHPVIVATNDGFIVVWSSVRDLRATRLTREGLIADLFGVPLSVERVGGGYSRPSVIFNGRTVVVFWFEEVTTPDYKTSQRLYLAEVTSSLEILQKHVEIATVGYNTAVYNDAPAVAWDGARYLVLTRGHRIVLDSSLRVVVDGWRTDVPLVEERLASDGSTFVLVGTNFSAAGWQIVAQQLLPDGRATGDRLVLGESFRGQASIAGSHDGYVVAWNRGNLELARITVPLRTIARGEVAGVPPGWETIASNIAWIGSSITATWVTAKYNPADRSLLAEEGSLLSATFPADLTAVPPAGVPMSAAPILPSELSVAALGGTTYVTWAAPRSLRDERSVQAQRVGATGDPIVISNASVPQDAPVVARSATAAVAVWRESDSSAVAARLTAAGTLDPGGITIPGAVAVASDGTDFLVVSTTGVFGASVTARLLHADGSVGTPVVLSPSPLAGRQFRVEWDGSEYVAAWTEPGAIEIVRLSGDGAVVSRQEIEADVVCCIDGNELHALACSSGECVIAWTEEAPRPAGTACCTTLVKASRLDRYSVIDQSPVLIATSPNRISKILVANNGRDSLVTWTDYVTISASLSKSEVRGARFAAGAPTVTAPTDDGFPVALAGTSRPVIISGMTSNAGGFALLWRFLSGDSFLTWLDSNGTANPSTTTKLPVLSVNMSLGSPAEGRIPIVYSRATADVVFGSSYRVFFREAFPAPPRARAVRGR